MTLGEIKRKIQELQDTFSALLQKAAEDPNTDYTEQFQNNTKDLLGGLSPQLTQWNENWIRQLIHTVKVISADHIRVCLNDGTEIDQTVDP